MNSEKKLHKIWVFTTKTIKKFLLKVIIPNNKNRTLLRVDLIWNACFLWQKKNNIIYLIP